MADTQHVRAKSREALHKALQRGGTKEGVSSDALVASVSLLAERVEAAMFEYYGRDLSLEHSHEGASAAEATPAEKLVTQHGDLVATEAYRQAVRAHVITLTSYNPRLAALLLDGDLSPDTFAVMSAQDMMSDSMQKRTEQTKQQFLNAERGYLPEKGDFVTPAAAGWDYEGMGNLDADPEVDADGGR